MTEPLILVVDDDARILEFVALELKAKEFRVTTARDGAIALNVAEEERPDLVVLDVTMPIMGGLEVLCRLREISNVPIILLTGRTLDQEKIRGLGMGADDYLAKPFNPDELIARIRTVLRRASPPAEIPQRAIESGDVVIDLDKRMVTWCGEMVVLTRTEWLLLQFLASRAGKVVTNRELLTKIWGQEYSTDLQYLRVWISRLRTKLGENAASGVLIKTLPGVGYMFTVSGKVPAEEEAPVLN